MFVPPYTLSFISKLIYIHTYIHIYIHTYILTYLIHGAESFLRS